MLGPQTPWNKDHWKDWISWMNQLLVKMVADAWSTNNIGQIPLERLDFLDESVQVVADSWSTNNIGQRLLERSDFLDESALGKSGWRAGCLMIHSYGAADQQTLLNCTEIQCNYDAHCIALYLLMQSNSNIWIKPQCSTMHWSALQCTTQPPLSPVTWP